MRLLFVLAVSIYNILSFGAAKGEDCTQAIQSAIDRCALEGGGKVVIPEGTFFSSTIYLRDNVDLHLEEGAVLRGVEDPTAYSHYAPVNDLSRYDSGGGTANANCVRDTVWMKALIIGAGVSDASITGPGTIDGGHVFNPEGEEGMRGPHLIIIAEADEFKLKDITLTRASNYAFLGYALTDPLFDNVTITEGWDGIHIRGCEGGEITNCCFKTGDDSIAGGYWKDFRIQDCTINSSCNGIRIIMPCQNLDITSCNFYGPGEYPHRTSGEARRCNMLFGISLEPGAWGSATGVMKDIRLTDLSMECLSSPVSTSVREGTDAQDLTINNLKVKGLTGAPVPIVSWNDLGFKTVTINNFSISR